MQFTAQFTSYCLFVFYFHHRASHRRRSGLVEDMKIVKAAPMAQAKQVARIFGNIDMVHNLHSKQYVALEEWCVCARDCVCVLCAFVWCACECVSCVCLCVYVSHLSSGFCRS